MDRHSPRAVSDAIDLYIKTYYSLLRSSGEVRVRAFEEGHVYSNSSLHTGARDMNADVAAFAYSAARLPTCMAQAQRIVMGQSHEQFEAAGFEVREWKRVKTRGRRRPLRWDGKNTLAAFIMSTSDIDDLVPIVVAYQLEWNKLHERLRESPVIEALKNPDSVDLKALGQALDLEVNDVITLCRGLGEQWHEGLKRIAQTSSDRSMLLLSGSYNEYQRAAQRWWGEVETVYLKKKEPRRPPVYFISSNTHSLVNLIGGYPRRYRDEILKFARKKNPENLWPLLEESLNRGEEDETSNLIYYVLRTFLHELESEISKRVDSVRKFELRSGIHTIDSPGKIDVGAQIFELSKLSPAQFDRRVQMPGLERLKESNAVIINIDYPLGMGAYHLFSRLAQGVGEVRGLYVMGKAATLNGRIGDVMVSTAVYDEHSENTYLYRNCFSARHVQPWLKEGTVFDSQKALTVRGAFLQNREYMSGFYRDGYTVLEMEAGPYLSAIYELVNPNRHPNDEIVHLSTITPFEVGILHYASDTPYSKRQSLLSKSLSYFGMDSTYSCSIAIMRKIFERELNFLQEQD